MRCVVVVVVVVLLWLWLWLLCNKIIKFSLSSLAEMAAATKRASCPRRRSSAIHHKQWSNAALDEAKYFKVFLLSFIKIFLCGHSYFENEQWEHQFHGMTVWVFGLQGHDVIKSSVRVHIVDSVFSLTPSNSPNLPIHRLHPHRVHKMQPTLYKLTTSPKIIPTSKPSVAIESTNCNSGSDSTSLDLRSTLACIGVRDDQCRYTGFVPSIIFRQNWGHSRNGRWAGSVELITFYGSNLFIVPLVR